MIDLKLLRADPDRVRESLRKRGSDVDLDSLIDLDGKYRELLGEVESIRAEQNRVTRMIADSKGTERDAAMASATEFSTRRKSREDELAAVRIRLDDLLGEVPNLVHLEAPEGASDEQNVELRQVGTKPGFGFIPKDHLELGEALDVIDVPRAAKVSGSRFGFLKGRAALLELSLMRFAVDTVAAKGFRPVIPPILVREEVLYGMGYFPASREEAYEIPLDNLFLSGTSEAPLAGMHSGEIIPLDSIPLRYSAFSSCFRREAGTYGRDTRGIIRVHQFEKVEMFSFCRAIDSDEEHSYLLEVEEGIFQSLRLPYRVVDVCAGELGAPYARKFDIEGWLPGSERWLELTSTSNAYDFQARRLGIRTKAGSTTELLHTLNGTAITNRAVVAIFENYQNADGTITVPDALRPYTGFEVIDQ